MPLNLHKIASGPLAAVQALEPVYWCRSLNHSNVAGQVTPQYAAPVYLYARIQSATDGALAHADMAGQNNVTRNFYLESSAEAKVDAVVRTANRGGDLLYVFSDANAPAGWWLITALVEDCSASGWVMVRATLQVKAPGGVTPPNLWGQP